MSFDTRSHRIFLIKFIVFARCCCEQHSERTGSLLRSNESHISLLTTVLRGQLTSILRAKKSNHRGCDSNERYRL